MEHWESLCPGGYRFVYDDALFRPGTDTFLLSSLPKLRPGLRVCDLGCGTGLLGLLLLQRQSSLQVTGVEILPQAVALAERAAAENGLEDRLTFRLGDLRQPLLLQRQSSLQVTGVEILPQAVALAERAAAENGLEDRLTFRLGDLRQPLLPAGAFDLVVCNPPYYPVGSGALPVADARRSARSETACTLPELCQTAARLLRWGGSFCLVHKPERLGDLCCALRASGLEAKRLRPVCQTALAPPSLLLLEARRGGKPGLSWEAPLVLRGPDGAPTAEVHAIYFRQQEDMP